MLNCNALLDLLLRFFYLYPRYYVMVNTPTALGADGSIMTSKMKPVCGCDEQNCANYVQMLVCSAITLNKYGEHGKQYTC